MNTDGVHARGRALAVGALIAPAGCFVLVVAAMLVAEAAGLEPIWSEPEVTLAEAAAARDGGMVLRLIRQGHDPNRAYPVREGLVRSGLHELTPVEAATAADRVDMLVLLEHNGATLDAPTRATLICLARELDRQEVIPFLSVGLSRAPECRDVPGAP